MYFVEFFFKTNYFCSNLDNSVFLLTMRNPRQICIKLCLDRGMKRWENRRFYSLIWGEEEMEKPHTIWLDQERGRSGETKVQWEKMVLALNFSLKRLFRLKRNKWQNLIYYFLYNAQVRWMCAYHKPPFISWASSFTFFN